MVEPPCCGDALRLTIILTSSLYFVSLKAFGSISFNLRKSLKKKEGRKEKEGKKRERERKKGGEYKSRIIKTTLYILPLFLFACFG